MRSKPTNARHARGRGQSLAEFALIFPVFLVLTLGVIDMARAFQAYVSLTNGVREAAIWAAQGDNYKRWCTAPAGKAPSPAVSVPCPTGTTSANQQDDPDNIAYRIDVESTGLDPNLITLEVPDCAGACTTSSTTVKIRATYRFTLLTPVLSSIVGNSLSLSAATSATILR